MHFQVKNTLKSNRNHTLTNLLHIKKKKKANQSNFLSEFYKLF